MSAWSTGLINISSMLTCGGRLATQRVERLKQMLANGAQERGSPLARTYRLVNAAAKKLAGFVTWELSSRTRRLSTRIRFRVLREVLDRGASWPSFLKELSVREIYDSAEERYVPKVFFGGGVVLARAQFGEDDDTPYCEIYADHSFGWKSISPEIAVIDVKGGHSSMLQEPFVESLASELTHKVKHDSAPMLAEVAANMSSEAMST